MIEVNVTCEIEDPTLRRIDDELSHFNVGADTRFSSGVVRELVHSILTMRILKLLLSSKASAHSTEVARKLSMDQPLVYTHLRKLYDLNLVARENSPLSCIVWYSLKPDRREDAKNLIRLYHAVISESLGRLAQQLVDQSNHELPRKELTEHPFFRDMCQTYGITRGEALALLAQSEHFKSSRDEQTGTNPEENGVWFPQKVSGKGLLDD